MAKSSARAQLPPFQINNPEAQEVRGYGDEEVPVPEDSAAAAAVVAAADPAAASEDKHLLRLKGNVVHCKTLI